MPSVRSLQLHPDTVHRGWLAAIPLCVLMSAALAEPARPIEATTSVAAASPGDPVAPDVIKQREQELEQARAAQKSAADAQARLKAEIAALGQDSSKLSQQLIEAASRVRTIETSIGDAEGRLHALDGREAQMRAALDSRRSDVVEVLAALQRAGRRSPPALLIRPEDALQSVRTAMLLGSLVPELRARAEKIAGENITVLSAGTDGVDGNSSAAGAVMDGTTMDRARGQGVDARAALGEFDAYPLFKALGDSIETGPTGNNLRDLRILLAY